MGAGKPLVIDVRTATTECAKELLQQVVVVTVSLSWPLPAIR